MSGNRKRNPQNPNLLNAILVKGENDAAASSVKRSCADESLRIASSTIASSPMPEDDAKPEPPARDPQVLSLRAYPNR